MAEWPEPLYWRSFIPSSEIFEHFIPNKHTHYEDDEAISSLIELLLIHSHKETEKHLKQSRWKSKHIFNANKNQRKETKC